jgi:hypothetical protein
MRDFSGAIMPSSDPHSPSQPRGGHGLSSPLARSTPALRNWMLTRRTTFHVFLSEQALLLQGG